MIKHFNNPKNLKFSVDQAVYRQVGLADRACLWGTNRNVAQIKMISHFQFFFFRIFLKIDIFWQLSAFSESRESREFLGHPVVKTHCCGPRVWYLVGELKSCQLLGCIIQHGEYSKYHIITLNGVWPIKIVNQYVVYL